MPAKSEKQRKAMAVALYSPNKLYNRNKAMAKMTPEQLHDFVKSVKKGKK